MADFEYVDVNGRQIRVRPRETAQEIDEYGNFHRQPNRFTEGFGEGKNPVEKDRYILFWAKGCNWSNRAAIARELLGLEDVFVTKKGGKEIKSFEDAAGLSFEGGTGISVSNAVEAWNEKNPDKAINITYSDADTSVFLQHVADGSQDFTIIDLAMYNSYMEEFNYDVQKNDIPEDEAKMIAENSYAYYIFPQDQKDLREQVDKALKELKEDGTLTEISKKWYGQDTAPEDDKFEETIN